MHGACITLTFGPSFSVSSASSRSEPIKAQDSESQTRTVTAGGGVSPSFTTSKCA